MEKNEQFIGNKRQFIKSTLFLNNINDNNNLNIKSSNKNKFHKRALTSNFEIFHLNEIGYIKNDIKCENKKIMEGKKVLERKNTFPNINNSINKIILFGKQKYNLGSFDESNKKNQNIRNKEKTYTEDKNAKFKTIKKEYLANKNNYDIIKTKKIKSSLSFGEVDEENNKEYSNNGSSYISKIESKIPSYEMDEELKELGNDIKTPVNNQNNINNRLVSSFSINNIDNDNEYENFDEQNNILLQLKRINSNVNKDNENKINQSPIVFDDKKELSFNEDFNQKSNSYQFKNLNTYNNDLNEITKINYIKDEKCSVSYIEKIKNKKFYFCYCNDIDIIKKINCNKITDINAIEKIRKKENKLKNNNKPNIPNNNNEDCKKNIKKVRNPNRNITNNNKKNNEKNSPKKNKKIFIKKEFILKNNKKKNNINNNLNANHIEKENIPSNKNYIIQTNEINKLIKEKINFLSMKIQNQTTTNKSRGENRINLTSFINTSLNNNKELSFNNNDLMVSKENNIFCIGREDFNRSNITYNRYYNGNNITMNNFYNNYKLNNSNNNIINKTEIKEENDLSFNNNIIFERNSNVIESIKKKMALKVKEEENKRKNDLDRKNKSLNINDFNSQNENNSKSQNKENLIKNFLITNYKSISNNGLNYSHRNLSFKNFPKYSSPTTTKNSIDISENKFNKIQFLKNIFNKNNLYYQSDITYSHLQLHSIKEQRYFSKNKKNANEKIYKIENNNNSSKVKNNSSSHNQLLNRKNLNKNHLINNHLLSNQINNINAKNQKANRNSSKNKFKSKNTKEKSLNKNNFNKNNSINNRNELKYLNKNNINNKSFNNFPHHKKNEISNCNVENNSKISNINNNYTSREVSYNQRNKNVINHESYKNHLTKTKITSYRNDRPKYGNHSKISTRNNISNKINNDFTGNNFNSNNHINSNNKSINKCNIKKCINKNGEKEKIIKKGKNNN